MKRVIFFKPILAVLVMAIGLMGCQKSPKHVTYLPPGPTGIEQQDDPRGPIVPPPRSATGPENDRGFALPPGPKVGSDPMPPPEGWDPNELPQRINREDMTADREQFSEQTVYFEFDRSSIQPSEQGKVETVASYMRSNPVTMLEIEGHCDERGTEEYNRALGERRALAVRDYLVNLGIEPHRLQTISYGEDRPAVEGHDEFAYAMNRRAEFVLFRP